MAFTWTRRRRDAATAVGLAIAIALSWAVEYRFFGEQRFRDPLSYRGDAQLTAAAVAAARRGDLVPFASKLMPSLGAPSVASWNDYPITEDWVIWGVGLLARATDTIVAINVGYMLAFVFAGVAMFFVARRFGLRRDAAVLAGFLFGLANYTFVRTVHHYTLTFCWIVPWNVLVASWLASRRGLPFKSRRFTLAVLVTVATAWGFIYYSFFAAQLYVLGAIAGFMRHQRRFAFKPVLALAGIFAAALLSVNLDTVLYQRANGPNDAAVARAPQDIEHFALKPINLFVPPGLHRFPFMREVARRAMEQTIINGEYPSPYLGWFGDLSLVGLALWGLWAMARQRIDRGLGWAGLTAWFIIAHSVGGLNSALGLTGFRLFRSVNRASIVIFAVVVLFGAWFLGERLRRVAPKVRWAVLVVLALGFALEQVPLTDPNETDAVNRRVADADRKLVAQMEAALPPGAMVFQLPAMHFPEVGPHYGVDSYELFRPTFYANTLRFSHGDVKGRPNAEWKFRVAALPPDQMVAELRRAGFAAMYVNRKGFPDGATGLLQGLQAQGVRLIAIADTQDTVALGL